MPRRKLIAGNWKMNGLAADLAELDAIAAAARSNPGVDVAICPPATLIAAAAARASGLERDREDHADARGEEIAEEADHGSAELSVLPELGGCLGGRSRGIKRAAQLAVRRQTNSVFRSP